MADINVSDIPSVVYCGGYERNRMTSQLPGYPDFAAVPTHKPGAMSTPTWSSRAGLSVVSKRVSGSAVAIPDDAPTEQTLAANAKKPMQSFRVMVNDCTVLSPDSERAMTSISALDFRRLSTSSSSRFFGAAATAVATVRASEIASLLVRECAVRVSNPGPAD
jgi:hypothetical protein